MPRLYIKFFKQPKLFIIMSETKLPASWGKKFFRIKITNKKLSNPFINLNIILLGFILVKIKPVN